MHHLRLMLEASADWGARVAAHRLRGRDGGVGAESGTPPPGLLLNLAPAARRLLRGATARTAAAVTATPTVTREAGTEPRQRIPAAWACTAPRGATTQRPFCLSHPSPQHRTTGPCCPCSPLRHWWMHTWEITCHHDRWEASQRHGALAGRRTCAIDQRRLRARGLAGTRRRNANGPLPSPVAQSRACWPAGHSPVCAPRPRRRLPSRVPWPSRVWRAQKRLAPFYPSIIRWQTLRLP